MNTSYALRRQEIVGALVAPRVFAEFHRINNINLRNQFYKELDRHTPKLITLFRDKATKTGKIAQELAKLIRIYDFQEQRDINMRRALVLRALPVYLREDAFKFFRTCNSADGPDLTDTPLALLTVVMDDTTDASLLSPESICIVVEDEILDNKPLKGRLLTLKNDLFSCSGYKLIKEQKTWRDAQTYCRKNYIDLVSVRNQTENENIKNVRQNSSNDYVWIGLFNDSWKWSDQSNSSFRYWSSNKPSKDLKCTAVNVSDQLYWSDVDCTENLPFICHHENKLVLIKQNLTWREALRYCRNNHYDLVSVLTQEMQVWVKEVAQDASTEHVWLGLRYDCIQSIWFWVFGSLICFQDWAPGNGNGFEICTNEERTGAVQSRGEQQWISLPQSNTLNFICSNY
ncbi:macrophage mannose receptor 1-like [Clarias gariepinus]|uniref:macrophage mannose receptor 1-like n=1 Tax=Clarias gariepinus TaxID=13013 RepID=UPI00234D8019|nr:macrophage mannose receptor 1-like [Clarias gariepinus]XP_053332750.1 macrophage mannose receptor 1-like [Clarias gariepinus]